MTRAIEILDRLVAFPTVSRDGNIDLIRYVADLLGGHDIAARMFEAPSGDRASLFASVGPATAGGIVLSGHTDVVPVDGQAWTCDPFRLTKRDGRLYGRGTADMKGFVACALNALLSAAEHGLARPLHVALSYDEEIGCVGVRPMLDALAGAGLDPDWVMIGEPTSMRVAIGHKGKINARATCCGRAAHSALAPSGLNAIHLAADFLGRIRSMQAEIEREGRRDTAYDVPYTTLHAGIIHGGTALNIVPERCVLDFEIRNLAEDDAGAVLDRLFAAAGEIAAEAKGRVPEADIRIEPLNTYPGLETPDDAQAVAIARSLSGEAMPVKVAFGTEGGLFGQALGRPVVVCGPGSMDQGHKADEFVTNAQMAACGATLERLVETLR